MESNQQPLEYESSALANWAILPIQNRALPQLDEENMNNEE